MGEDQNRPECLLPVTTRMKEILRPLEPIETDVQRRVERIPGLRAVLFDVYGTMLVSGSGDVGTAAATDDAGAAREALKCAGFEGDLDAAGKAAIQYLPEEIGRVHEEKHRGGIEYPEVEIREVWREVVIRLTGAGLLSAEATASKIQHLAVEYECRVNPVWPMPGLMETLVALRSCGLRVGIVSNAQFYTSLVIEALLGTDLPSMGFAPEFCCWSWEEGEAKPSIGLFEKMEHALREVAGLRPESALYVGNDMLNDMSAAARCGFKTALFAGDRRSLRLRDGDSRCAGVTPDVVVKQLADLLDVAGTMEGPE